MANNVFQVKRTNVSGRTPNTTGSYATNSQYIAAGEFALNMADGILYTSNGSTLITVGSNLTSLSVTGSATFQNTISVGNQVFYAHGTDGFSVNENFNIGNSTVTGYHFTSGNNARTQTSFTIARTGAFTAGFGISGDSSNNIFVIGSEYSNTNFIFKRGIGMPFGVSGGTTLFTVANNGNLILTGGINANGSLGTSGQVLSSNGTSTYWATPGAGSVDVNAQYVWTNTHLFNANLSVNATFSVVNSTANVLFAVANGNIGIGNTTPAYKLRVEGDISLLSGIHANGSLGTAGQVLTSNGTAVYWTAAAGGGYYKGGSAAVGSLAVGGQNLFRVNANTLNNNTTIATGENAQATGPISVASGITLTVESGARVAIV